MPSPHASPAFHRSPGPNRSPGGDMEIEIDAGDTLDPTFLRALKTEPGSTREAQHADMIADILGKLGATFVSSSNVSDEQLSDVAKSCVYRYFPEGSDICSADDETEYFFVVLAGSVEIEERTVSHLEGAGEKGTSMRTATCTAGCGFHHFPLVMTSPFYGYSARVTNPAGASIVMISKVDYVHFLRRNIDKDMNDTVLMLKATPFFTTWSEMSVARLYFWFERRKFQAEADVVSQGDDANFCFIIRSGRCDVLVEVDDEDEGSAGGGGGGGGGKDLGSTAERKASVVNELGTIAVHESGNTPQSSPDVSPEMRRAQAEDAEAAAKLKELQKKRQSALKMMAASAFKSNTATADDVKLRANMRHVVTLRPGAIVGEIALFKDGVKRMATVRTSEPTEVLILDKKSFLDLDRATLNIISENARYNAACTKEPGQRARDDLQILQQRTQHLSFVASLSAEVHLELCRVMRYRKVSESAILVRKGAPANCLYVLISGSAACHTAEPRAARGWKMLATGGDKKVKKKLPGADAYAGMKPSDVLRSGQAIGEDELLQEDPVHAFTAVTTEPVELMEIERRDFDRILKADRTSEKGRLIEFLTGLSMMSGTSVAALNALANVVHRRAFMRDQLCLAHPPDPTLGASSFSNEYAYIIYSGEARLLVGDADGRAAPTIEPGVAYGPLAETPLPASRRLLTHMGQKVVPCATLGPGECIMENLLNEPGARWCLKPITQMELLVIPRKDWSDTLRAGAIQDLRELTRARGQWFISHTQHFFTMPTDQPLIQKSGASSRPIKMQFAQSSPRKSRNPSSDAHGFAKTAAAASLMPSRDVSPPLRNAYEPINNTPRGGGGGGGGNSPRLPPIDSARRHGLSPESSPRKQAGASVTALPELTDPAAPGSHVGPRIQLGRSSTMGARPLIY